MLCVFVCLQSYLRQRGLFMTQVQNVSRLPLLKQYLLLYSSISLPKLAGLLETDEASLRMALACLKKANYWYVPHQHNMFSVGISTRLAAWICKVVSTAGTKCYVVKSDLALYI